MIIDIKNSYVGDASVSRLYQGETLVWDASHPDILLNYIQAGETPSSGVSRTGVYFNTGLYPDSSTDIELSYQNTIYGTGGSSYSYMLIGCSHTTGGGYSFSGDHYIASPGAGKTWRYRNNSNVLAPDSSADLNKHTIRTVNNGTNQTVYYDGVATTGSSSSLKTFELPLYLFCFNTNGNADSYALKGTRIYYVKIWQSNNLVRFYVPVLHYINGQYTPCFYDKVNNTYIYNLGTDDVVYKISGDYLLDYLGAQPETEIPTAVRTNIRYETGVNVSANLQTDIKCRGMYGQENYLFGAATDGTTTPAWQVYGIGFPGSLNQLRINYAATASGTAVQDVAIDSSAVTEPHVYSIYYDNQNPCSYYDSSFYKRTDQQIVNYPVTTIHLFSRHGNSQYVQPANGARIYYANFTVSNVPSKTIIPVLHNGKPEFLDLQSGSYLQKFGSGEAYYSFQK